MKITKKLGSLLILAMGAPVSEAAGEINNLRSAEDSVANPAGAPLALKQRIMGGAGVTDTDFAFFVSLMTAAGTPFCGGSLLDEYHVLTAAHCIVTCPPGSDDEAALELPDAIKLGRIADGALYGHTYFVECASIHPDFSADADNDLFGDVAVLKLSEPVSLFPFDKIYTTLGEPPETEDTELMVMGFGDNYDGRFKKRAVNFKPEDKCQDEGGMEDTCKEFHLCTDRLDKEYHSGKLIKAATTCFRCLELLRYLIFSLKTHFIIKQRRYWRSPDQCCRCSSWHCILPPG